MSGLSIGSETPSAPADYHLLLAIVHGNEAQAAKLAELKEAQAAATAALAELNLGKAAAQAFAEAKVEREEAHNLLVSIQESHASTVEAARIAAATIIGEANQKHDAAAANAFDLVQQGRAEAERLIADARVKVAAVEEAWARADEALKAAQAAQAKAVAHIATADSARDQYETALRQLQAKLDILNAAVIQATDPATEKT